MSAPGRLFFRSRGLQLIAAGLGVMLSLGATAAFAELTHSAASGFSVSHEAVVEVPPATAFAAMTGPIDEWWEGAHSWSGDATNLYFEATLGGCFCEHLPGGGVEHLRIIYFDAPSEVRLQGALGPLQQMGVAGFMRWTVTATEAGTRINFNYQVSGELPEERLKGGLPAIAPAVDGVIGAQLQGLVSYLQTQPTQDN